MNNDLATILSGWDYDPNEVRARYVRTADGSRQIQLRLDLGCSRCAPRAGPTAKRRAGFRR
jgi:hypothetical protein